VIWLALVNRSSRSLTWPADDRGERAARIAFLAETDQGEIESHCVAEDGVLLADIAIRWIRKTAEFLRILLVLGKELHHFVWPGVSGRSEEKCVYQAEHGGVGADPKGQHEHGREGEAWRP
jgi:hypothetical protein